MNSKSLAVITALAASLALGSIVRAADKPMDKASTEPTYIAACPSPCDFRVSGHNKAEVAAIIKEHAKTHHQMNPTDEEVDGLIKVRQPKKQ